MKKFLSLVFISFFFFNLTQAAVKIKGQEYWSNEKDGPTTIEGAKKFIYKKFIDNLPVNSKKIDDPTSLYPSLTGIWYSEYFGFLAIYEESYNSNIFKVRLIKRPFGFGNNSPEYKNPPVYELIKKEEGTIKGTIIKAHDLDGPAGSYTIHYRQQWLKSPSEYETITAKIEQKSKFQFRIGYESELESEKLVFNKILPRPYKILKTLKNIDSSKKISDFEIQSTLSGLMIYIDNNFKGSKENLIRNDKFISIMPNSEVKAGDMYRGFGTENRGKNGISYIHCNTVGFLTYSKHIDDNVIDSSTFSGCDSLKTTYSTYKKYKFKNKYKDYFNWYNKNESLVGLSLGGLIIALILFYISRQRRKVELSDYNKKNKTKFKNYSEYQEHLQKIEDIRWEKDQKEQEKERKAQATKRKAEEAKRLKEEERLEVEERRKERLEEDDPPEENDSSLSGKVKRLRSLYKNGTLTKAEFEQAKNKLLK